MVVSRLFRKIRLRIYKSRFFGIGNVKCSCKSDIVIHGEIYNFCSGKIIFGGKCSLFPGVIFMGDGDIFIGDDTHIGNNTYIYSSKNAGVTIGCKTMLAADCCIIDADHGYKQLDVPMVEQQNNEKKVIIGNNVWIGNKSTVLKGSIINDGVVVGAMSLVNKELESNCVYVGIPVRKLKNRNE